MRRPAWLHPAMSLAVVVGALLLLRFGCTATTSAQALGAGEAGAADAPRPVAIVGATIYPVSGPKIEKGTLVIAAGRIVAVGASVPVPADAVRIDGAGTVVTPGFVDVLTHDGVSDVDSEDTASDAGLTNDHAVNAAYDVADAINPRSWRLPIDRAGGLTSVVVAPVNGVIAGSAAWLDLGGTTPGTEGAVVRSPLAMFATFGNPSRGVAGHAFGGQLMVLREALDDARDYDAHRAQYEANGLRKLAVSRLDLEALVPVVRGALPLYLEVHRASEIETALALAARENLHLVIAGAEEAWMVAPALAAARVPIAIDPIADLPYTFDSLGARLDNAALCARAGVSVAFTTGTEYVQDPAQPRLLRQRAGIAVANGMPYDAALAALTRVPAQAFGVGDAYGTLEPGRVANLVVWSGDPLELSSRPLHVFVAGAERSLRTRQTELFERYRVRDMATSQPAGRP